MRVNISDWLTKSGLARIEELARKGLNDEQISKEIGITRQTLSNWRKKHPEIDEALKKGKVTVDDEVENAFLKLCMGYDYTIGEVKFDAKGKKTGSVTQKRHMPPNVHACMFWLKCRRPDKWRDNKQEIDNSETMNKLDDVLKKIGGSF